jgi:TonB family protein
MDAGRRPIAIWLTALLLLTPLTAGAQAPSRPTGDPMPPPPVRSEAELLAAVAAEPSDLRPYLELASLYLRANRRADSIRILRQALTHHPDSSAVFSALMLYTDPDRDPADFQALVMEWRNLDPSDTRPLLFAAGIHLRSASVTGDLSARQAHVQQASQLLEDVRTMNPTSPGQRGQYLNHLKLLIGFTDDPVERQRLTTELEAGLKDFGVFQASGGVAVAQSSGGSAAAPPPSWPAGAVRVGGNIKPPVKTKTVEAIWPPAAQQARVQGVVILEILIDEAGKVADAKVLRSIPLLDVAAIEAVRQWEFEPTLLNGVPVPVIMTATVQFRLAPQFR